MQADKLATPSRPALALLLAAVLLSSPALLAQGLGELTLQSALNEPLRASIELIDVAGLEQGQLIINLASTDEYEAAGLERSGLLSQIEFDVQLQPLGSGRVILSTRDRVNEPFLSLLVSARWPSGRVLRDYTVLLDLPGTATASAAATGQAAAPQRSTETFVNRVAAPEGGAGESYTVQAGDSLWQIAEQRRPGPDVSVPQMMIALQRANEDAFVNNNINRLVSGRVLRIPTREEIAIIEPAAAVAQVNAQNREVGLMPLGGTGTATAGSGRDELSVLSGDAPAGGGAGSSDLDATIAALEAELMLSEEELDRARLENEELTARLDELEEQIAILQNIIAIEDERLAQLQNELAAQAEVTDQALAEASRAAELLAAARQPAPQGLMGQVLAALQNNLVFIGGALAVVLALLGLLVARARKAREEDAAAAYLEDEEALFAGAADDTQPVDTVDEFEAAMDEELAELDDTGARADESQDFVSRLLARFRRRSDAEEAGADEAGGPAGASAVATAPELRRAAGVPGIEVDEIPDELSAGLYSEEDDSIPTLAAGQDLAGYADAADSDDEEAAALASSVLDEVDSALRQIEDAAASTDAERADLGAEVTELEFDLGADAPAAAAQPAAAETLPEGLEFKVEPQPAAVAADTAAGTAPDIESFAFTLEPEPATAAAPDPEPVAEIETFEFKPVGDNGGFDLGSLTFDESDARAAEEDESVYTPRTNMDECDTKLDLAVAYEAMGDIDGAIEILEEVIAEGKPAQIEEAQRLKAKWQDA